MTRALLSFTFILLTLTSNLKAQDEVLLYKKLFAYSDSLSKTAQKGVVSNDITKTLKELDKKHPASFFDKSGELLKAGKFNDASLVYYVGYFRYRYFNLVNPDYKPSEDGALLGSLNSIMDQPINLFLRSDIDNFTEILKHTKSWLTNNDYTFISKSKEIEKYNEEVSQLDTLITDFTSNKVKYQNEWIKEQSETRKAIIEMEKPKASTVSKPRQKAKKKA